MVHMRLFIRVFSGYHERITVVPECFFQVRVICSSVKRGSFRAWALAGCGTPDIWVDACFRYRLGINTIDSCAYYSH